MACRISEALRRPCAALSGPHRANRQADRPRGPRLAAWVGDDHAKRNVVIIPSIDLSQGKVVAWRRGREPLLERDDAEALAVRYGRHGEVAVIDLDAALGIGENTDLVCKLCRIAPCRVGGGIRT